MEVWGTSKPCLSSQAFKSDSIMKLLALHIPSLDIPPRVSPTGPRLVEPIAGVRGGLASLPGDALIVRPDMLEHDVPGPRLRHLDVVLVAEGLELAVGPGVEDPALDVAPGLLRLVLGLVPRVLDLGDEALLRVVDIAANGLEVVAQVGGVPVLVGGHDVAVPVLADQGLEVAARGGRRVGDVVVGEPALELSLVPFVVGWNGKGLDGEKEFDCHP